MQRRWGSDADVAMEDALEAEQLMVNNGNGSVNGSVNGNGNGTSTSVNVSTLLAAETRKRRVPSVPSPVAKLHRWSTMRIILVALVLLVVVNVAFHWMHFWSPLHDIKLTPKAMREQQGGGGGGHLRGNADMIDDQETVLKDAGAGMGVESDDTLNPWRASGSLKLDARSTYDAKYHTRDQKQVVEMLKWAWNGYKTHAWGFDSLDTKDLKGTGNPEHDMALTMVDSLDTLFIAGLFDEYDEASAWVAKNFKSKIIKPGFISIFETTIRLVGGLLSTFTLTGEKHLLSLADDLTEAMYPAFSKYSHGIPAKDWDFKNKFTQDMSSVAEAGSIQMEFKYLTRLTGKKRYRDVAERIMDSLFRDVHESYPDGLLPVTINAHNGRVRDSKITLGAHGDSYYEYLLKQWLLSGKKDEKYKKEYMRAVDGINKRLVAKSVPSGLTFIGEIEVPDHFSPKMDHLVCFVPGMLALGYLHGMPKAHLELAEELLETCYQMYAQMAAKLAPEIVYFNTDASATSSPDIIVHANDAFNLLRPETVESLMILWRVTRKEKYREYGRAIMQAFEKQSKVEGGGYASIGNVWKGPKFTKPFRKEMESFFIGETLKYLFLLFCDEQHEVLPLNEIVFNTEAHAFQMDL